MPLIKRFSRIADQIDTISTTQCIHLMPVAEDHMSVLCAGQLPYDQVRVADLNRILFLNLVSCSYPTSILISTRFIFHSYYIPSAPILIVDSGVTTGSFSVSHMHGPTSPLSTRMVTISDLCPHTLPILMTCSLTLSYVSPIYSVPVGRWIGSQNIDLDSPRPLHLPYASSTCPTGLCG